MFLINLFLRFALFIIGSLISLQLHAQDAVQAAQPSAQATPAPLMPADKFTPTAPESSDKSVEAPLPPVTDKKTDTPPSAPVEEKKVPSLDEKEVALKAKQEALDAKAKALDVQLTNHNEAANIHLKPAEEKKADVSKEVTKTTDAEAAEFKAKQEALDAKVKALDTRLKSSAVESTVGSDKPELPSTLKAEIAELKAAINVLADRVTTLESKNGSSVSPQERSLFAPVSRVASQATSFFMSHIWEPVVKMWHNYQSPVVK